MRNIIWPVLSPQWIRIYVFILGFSALFTTKGEIRLKDEIDKRRIEDSEIQWWMDTSNALSPDQVLDRFMSNGNKGNTQNPDFDNLKNMKATYWVWVKCDNKTHFQDWIIEAQDPHVAYVEVFQYVGNGEFKNLGKSGLLLPFRERSIAHKNHLFAVSMPVGSQGQFLVKFRSPYFVKMYLSVLPATNQIGAYIFEYWFLGLYYGSLLVLGFYNFIVFLYSRKTVYLWYVSYTLACIFSGLREDGLGFQYFWPDWPGFNLFHFQLSHLLLLYTFVFFSMRFLEVPFWKGFKGKFMMGLLAVYTFLFWVEDSLFKFWKVGSYLYLIPFFLLLGYAIKLVLDGNRSARLYLWGFSMLVIGVFSFSLRINDFIPHNFFTVYIFNFSILTEVVIMSLAMSYQYKSKQEELVQSQRKELYLAQENEKVQQLLMQEMAAKNELKESINQQLEKKVMEKTVSLSKKNEELAMAYEKLDFYTKKLESFGAQLDKENWELNKKVKQSLFDKVRAKGLTLEEFEAIYPDNDTCMRYLAETKWAAGFICRNCGNTKFTTGDLPYSRKCTKCTTRETALSHTMFHGLKFDLKKAMYVAYVVHDGHIEAQGKKLSEDLHLRTATLYGFKKKAEEHMAYLQIKLGKAVEWEKFITEPVKETV